MHPSLRTWIQATAGSPKVHSRHGTKLEIADPLGSHNLVAFGTVCQISLFFSLVSSIGLKIESDSSSEVLGVLLLIMLAVPPVLA